MPWSQLTFRTDPEHAEPLEDLLLGLGASAVTLKDAADQPLYEPDPGTTPLWRQTLVTALFPGDTDLAAIEQALADARQHQPVPAWQHHVVEDQDWERAWMDDFKPMRFGKRLWIVPSWHQPPDPEAVNLLLDPGLAFGTGTHPTTALCLEWLDASDLAGKQVVDYGCGSGILAIAAARLGANRVLATDIDPQALQATRDNAERNDVATHIEVCLPDRLPACQADIVLANILAGPLEALAPRLAGLVRPGGSAVLSGLLAEQAEPLRQIYARHFFMQPANVLDGWARLSGTRKEPVA